MQKKALILESHHSTHIEGTALSLETAQRDLEDMMEKGIIKAMAKSLTDPTKHYVLQ